MHIAIGFGSLMIIFLVFKVVEEIVKFFQDSREKVTKQGLLKLELVDMLKNIVSDLYSSNPVSNEETILEVRDDSYVKDSLKEEISYLLKECGIADKPKKGSFWKGFFFALFGVGLFVFVFKLINLYLFLNF
ncbi:MAG: hypothetical protein ACOCP8_03565 [archaeon]